MQYFSANPWLQQQGEEINWEQYWNPRLSIDNAFGEPKENTWYTVLFDSNSQATICERRRVNGQFLEFMELNEFPFDTQASLIMEGWRAKYIILIIHLNRCSGANDKRF